MKIRILLLSLFSLLLLCACHQQKPGDPLQKTDAATRYASLLQMQDVDEGRTICRIMNPWQPDRIAIQYLLTENTIDEPELEEYENQFGSFQVLETPLSNQTLTASCHLWLLEQLGALNAVKVVCDAEYVMIPSVKGKLANGEMIDGGSSMAPNAEVIRSVNSTGIWVSPYEATSQMIVMAQLPDLPIIYCADYMETSPLARAEWMRFYGRLAGKAHTADSLFLVVENDYNTLCTAGHSDSEQTTSEQSKDSCLKLLSDLPYGATWYVPGGRSTLGLMYQDAGFQYPWAEDTHGGSLALSPEAIFANNHDADIWIFKHHDESQTSFSLGWLLAQNPLYGKFKAAQTGYIYGCNTAHSDYFDATPFRPDILLQELQWLKAGKEDSLRFFVKLKE